MVFYIDPPDGGKRKPAPRDPEVERLQKLENATFVTGELGRFSRTLNDEFRKQVNAGGARGAAFSEDMKHLGLGLIDDALAGIETLPQGRPRIDEVGRGRFRERARAMLTLKLDEGKKLQARQSERDALGALSAVGKELSEVAGRRPNDFAAIRENLGRAVDEFTGVFGAEREASIRRELDDDLFVSKLKGIAASDLDRALAELDDPANLPGQDEEEREELRARLRMMAAASRENTELAEMARHGGERREDAAATAQLDATLIAAEHVGTPAALKEARAALNTAVTRGGLAPARFDEVLARLKAREATLIARDGRIARIEALLAANGAPDPNDADDRLAVDEHFAFYRESLAGLSEDERILAPAAYAGRVGMIPAPLAHEIEGGLLAKDPAAQVNAAKRFSIVEKQLPKPCSDEPFVFVPCARPRCLSKWAAFELPAAEIVERADAECPILPGYGPGEEGGFRALPYRPGEDQGELRTRPFKPGEGAGEVRTLLYKPGEDDARVVLLAARASAGRGDAGSTGESEEGVSETLAGEGGNENLVGASASDGEAESPPDDEATSTDHPDEPGLDIDIRPEALEEIEAVKNNPDQVQHVNMWEARRWAILNEQPAIFEIADNPEEEGEAPWYRDEDMGFEIVDKYENVIEAEAAKFGVDPDLVRAIMYVENADGNPLDLNRMLEFVGVARSTLPMNINPTIWDGMGEVSGDEFDDPELNIRAGVALIKEISDRLPEQDRTPAKIGSIWNSAKAEHVNDVGARIGNAFDARSWEN